MPRRRWLKFATAALFALLCLAPPLLLLGAAFAGSPDEVRGRFSSLLLDARQLGLLWNSVRIGALTALVATLVGAPLGFLLARTDLPGKAVLGVVLVAPAVIPPYVLGIAYTELLGDLRRGFGEAVPRLAGVPGSVFLLAAALHPLVVLLAAKGFASVDGAAEEASLLARGRVPTLFRVTLRLALPAILAGSLFVFVFAVSDFSIPDFLSFAGPPDRIVHVYATEIYSQFARARSAESAAVASLPIVLLVAAAVLLLVRLEGRGDFSISGPRVPPARIALGRLRVPAVLFAGLVAVVATLLPVAQLLRWALREGPEGARLDALRAAFVEAGPDLGRSLLIALCTGAALAALAFLLAAAFFSTKRSRVVSALVLLPLAFPAVMLAIGEIRLWNHPHNPLAGAVYDSPLLIGLTFMGRFLPFAALILRAGFLNLDPALEEASRLAGRSEPVTLLRITAPRLGRTLLAAFAVGFLLSMRELDSVTLLPAGSDTLPHRVYAMVHTSRDRVIAALCLVLVAATAVPLVLARFLVRGRDPGT